MAITVLDARSTYGGNFKLTLHLFEPHDPFISATKTGKFKEEVEKAQLHKQLQVLVSTKTNGRIPEEFMTHQS